MALADILSWMPVALLVGWMVGDAYLKSRDYR